MALTLLVALLLRQVQRRRLVADRPQELSGNVPMEEMYRVRTA